MTAAFSIAGRRPHFPRRTVITLLAIAALLLFLRAVAPYVLLKLINDRLANIPEYSGRVGSVELAVLRGAYAMNDVKVMKRNGQLAEPFIAASRIDFSLAWRELFHGKIVSDIHVERGELTFVRGPDANRTQVPADKRWQEVIEDLFPIDITYLEIRDGTLRYIDFSQPEYTNISVNEAHVIATGLRNRQSEEQKELPARISVVGRTIGNGNLTIQLGAAPLSPQPYFDLDLKLRDVQLPEVNDFLRRYANVDVSRGTFQLFVEAAGRDGGYEGYVKPFFENLDFENLSDRERSFGGRVWESVVATLNTLFKNHRRDQLGTRVPFSGNFERTNVGTWTGIVNTVRNGFIRAFSESIDGTIRPSDVKSGGQPASGEK